CNFPVSIDIMDIPISGTNITFATSTVTISNLSVNPPLKLIRVETVWPFPGGGRFTNSVITYRAPDQ
ncbi:MAG TPA: hypothetical protein PKA41_19215, partial [Verrucomicrobiota bacterium]|nr:hypothetical protein [Verrucomicrobiota bacterium]